MPRELTQTMKDMIFFRVSHDVAQLLLHFKKQDEAVAPQKVVEILKSVISQEACDVPAGLPQRVVLELRRILSSGFETLKKLGIINNPRDTIRIDTPEQLEDFKQNIADAFVQFLPKILEQSRSFKNITLDAGSATLHHSALMLA